MTLDFSQGDLDVARDKRRNETPALPGRPGSFPAGPGPEKVGIQVLGTPELRLSRAEGFFFIHPPDDEVFDLIHQVAFEFSQVAVLHGLSCLNLPSPSFDGLSQIEHARLPSWLGFGSGIAILPRPQDPISCRRRRGRSATAPSLFPALRVRRASADSTSGSARFP